MEQNSTPSAVKLRPRSETSRTKRAPETARAQIARRPHTQQRKLRAVASVRTRRHTLILNGELHHRSAHTLEAEIERLCEDGVTGITLDLRQLDYIDSIGIAVIAFRSNLCKRRGYDFAVIPGSRVIRRALEQAGVSDLLPADHEDIVARRLQAVMSGENPDGGSDL